MEVATRNARVGTGKGNTAKEGCKVGKNSGNQQLRTVFCCSRRKVINTFVHGRSSWVHNVSETPSRCPSPPSFVLPPLCYLLPYLHLIQWFLSLSVCPHLRRAQCWYRSGSNKLLTFGDDAGKHLPESIPRTHAHEQPSQAVNPPVLGWSKKQYSRPPTWMHSGVKHPLKPASEWSEAWTATIKENSKATNLAKETTVFLVNPGRFYLASCDVTSPRCTRRAFGLNTKEFYAIVEPVKTPPPSREAMLVRRHGGIERTRGKYDSRTCQLGFGIVEHAERLSDRKAMSEQRVLDAAPREQSRISLLEISHKGLRSGTLPPCPISKYYL